MLFFPSKIADPKLNKIERKAKKVLTTFPGDKKRRDWAI